MFVAVSTSSMISTTGFTDNAHQSTNASNNSSSFASFVSLFKNPSICFRLSSEIFNPYLVSLFNNLEKALTKDSSVENPALEIFSKEMLATSYVFSNAFLNALSVVVFPYCLARLIVKYFPASTSFFISFTLSDRSTI